MNLEKLIKIKNEIKTFQNKIDEGIKLAKTVKGWKSYDSNKMYGVNDISGTRTSGHIKRGMLDLKYFLNKNF